MPRPGRSSRATSARGGGAPEEGTWRELQMSPPGFFRGMTLDLGSVLRAAAGVGASPFTPRIEYLNPSPLQPERLPRIQIPSGVSPRMPHFVDTDRLIREKSRQLPPLASGSSVQVRGGLAITRGLTMAHFYLDFPDFGAQWREVNLRGLTEPHCQFLGGNIQVVVAIEVYVLESYRPEVDSTNSAIFALVLEHELHHVRDSIDLAVSFMPARLLGDELSRRYLIDRQSIERRSLSYYFEGHRLPRNVETELDQPRSGLGFETLVRGSIWGPEASRRADALHALELQRYADRIQDLERARVNGRLWRGGPGGDPWRD